MMHATDYKWLRNRKVQLYFSRKDGLLPGSCSKNSLDTTGSNQLYRVFVRFLIHSYMVFDKNLMDSHHPIKSNNGRYLMVPNAGIIGNSSDSDRQIRYQKSDGIGYMVH